MLFLMLCAEYTVFIYVISPTMASYGKYIIFAAIIPALQFLSPLAYNCINCWLIDASGICGT